MAEGALAEGEDLRRLVELEHRSIERHGDGWEGVSAGVAGDDGWPLYLRRFAGLFGKGQ